MNCYIRNKLCLNQSQRQVSSNHNFREKIKIKKKARKKERKKKKKKARKKEKRKKEKRKARRAEAGESNRICPHYKHDALPLGPTGSCSLHHHGCLIKNGTSASCNMFKPPVSPRNVHRITRALFLSLANGRLITGCLRAVGTHLSARPGPEKIARLVWRPASVKSV